MADHAQDSLEFRGRKVGDLDLASACVAGQFNFRMKERTETLRNVLQIRFVFDDAARLRTLFRVLEGLAELFRLTDTQTLFDDDVAAAKHQLFVFKR